MKLRSLILALPPLACGGAAPERASPAVVRLAPVPSAVSLPDTRVVQRLECPPALEPWLVESPRAEVEPGPFGRSARRLALAGKGPKRVSLPLAPPGGAFNEVRLTLASEFRGAAGIRLRAAGGVELVAGPRTVPASTEPVEVSLSLPREVAEGEALEGLDLALELRAHSWLYAVELVARPLSAALPAPGEAPELIAVAQDLRRGYGLSTGAPLAVELIPGAGSALVLDYATPVGLSRPSVPQELRVVLELRGAAPRTSVFPVGGGPSDPAGWRTSALDLGELAGRKLTVRLELASGGPAPDLCALGEPLVVTRSEAPRTVLLVTSDTHRADHLGSAGAGVEVDTPALDELAARGVTFEDAWSASNTTVPSHSAILTALHPRDTKVLSNESMLPEEALTLAEVFQAEGYRTFAAISAAHLSDEYSALGQGFDRMWRPGGSESRAAEAADTLLRWIDEADGQPVFAWLHLFDAHAPYAPPAPFDRRYYPPDQDPFDASRPPLERAERLPEWLSGLRDRAFPRAQYRAEVSYVDSALAQLLEHRRVRDGIVAFTGDHGEIFERGDTYYGHQGLYPATLHVPLILAFPGAPAGTRVREPVHQTDLGRTVLDLAGLAQRAFPGASLLGRAGDASGSDTRRFALSSRGTVASMTEGRWHCVLTLQETGKPEDGSARRHAFELYDVREDPDCRVDRAAGEPEVARRLRRALLAWLEAADDTLHARKADLGAAERANLEGLGYAADDGPETELGVDPDCACEECGRWR